MARKPRSSKPKPSKPAAKKTTKARSQALHPGKPGVKPLKMTFEHLTPTALPGTPAVQVITVDFTPRPTDDDVSDQDDASLGHTVRMTTEEGAGAWVFEALDASAKRRRWLRTVPKP